MSGQDEKSVLDGYIWKVKVSARGHLGCNIKEFFDEMEITDCDDGTTKIEGFLADLPEVFGFIIWLRDTMVQLNQLNVTRIRINSRVF
jgi:hypothetical protein